MLNIFNLFLFLLLLWLGLMFGAEHFSFTYLIFGILAASLVALGSSRLKLIKKDSELLYLSFGFYRHFINLYFKNFLSSLALIIDLAFLTKSIRPLLYEIKNDFQKINPSLMIISLNMSSGLLYVGTKKENFIVHAINEKYFTNFNALKISKNLLNVNDDNLV